MHAGSRHTQAHAHLGTHSCACSHMLAHTYAQTRKSSRHAHTRTRTLKLTLTRTHTDMSPYARTRTRAREHAHVQLSRQRRRFSQTSAVAGHPQKSQLTGSWCKYRVSAVNRCRGIQLKPSCPSTSGRGESNNNSPRRVAEQQPSANLVAWWTLCRRFGGRAG
jgi:hypothetical protein